MIATKSYIPPKKWRDHENMIAWAMKYFMTQEFEILDPEVQTLCENHIEERAQVAASEKPGAATPTAQVPGLPPGPAPSEPAGAVPPPAGSPEPAPIQ